MSLGAFRTLEFYEVVWEGEVLVLLGMFDKIHLWSHPVQGFCLLEVFFVTASISLSEFYSDSLILPDLVWEDCMFLGIYPFHPGCPVCLKETEESK